MRRMIPDNKWKKQVEDLQALLNGYTSDDASTKKIYYHPIYFYIGSGADPNIVLQMAILDNSKNAYTSPNFKIKLKALLDAGAIINVNGIYKASAEDNYAQAFMILKSGADYNLFYADGSTFTSTALDIDNLTFNGFVDGVNAIN